MQTGQPSRTTVLPAVLRAAHQLFDRPLIFEDSLAVGLLPQTAEQSILASEAELRSPHMTLVRALMAMRSRFVEDRLTLAAMRGIRQYVIVATGFDTFPWRQPSFARDMRIFAADYPATLVSTQQLLRERGFVKPPNVTFVPADLEQQRIDRDLAKVGFLHDAPAFGSVLGLTQYLTREAATSLCRFFASLPKGSEVVLSFAPPEDELDSADLDEARASATRTADLGEPWLTRLGPTEFVEQLTGMGFRDVFHLTPELAQERYFKGRRDGLRPPRWEQLIAAIV